MATSDENNQTVDWKQCLCHKQGVQADLTAFTDVSWKKIREAAMIRKDITYELLKPYLEEKPRGYYHRPCYQNYTHKQKLERISSKRQLDNDGTSLDSQPRSSTSQPSPRKRRSLTVKTTISSRLMCQQDKYDKKKRSRENLTQLLTYDAAIKIQRAAQSSL